MGLITAHRTTGACNSTDYVSRLLRAVVAMGAYIDDSTAELDMVHTDWRSDTQWLVTAYRLL